MCPPPLQALDPRGGDRGGNGRVLVKCTLSKDVECLCGRVGWSGNLIHASTKALQQLFSAIRASPHFLVSQPSPSLALARFLTLPLTISSSSLTFPWQYLCPTLSHWQGLCRMLCPLEFPVCDISSLLLPAQERFLPDTRLAQPPSLSQVRFFSLHSFRLFVLCPVPRMRAWPLPLGSAHCMYTHFTGKRTEAKMGS